MLKKIYSAIALSFISITALGMSVSELSNQLIHVQTQIKSVTQSWQRAEMTLQKVQKAAPDIYGQLESTAKNLLDLEDISTKMNELVDQQVNAITDYNMPYKAINFLTDYFADKIANAKPLLRTICVALANKQYRSLLGRKLTTKRNELIAAIEVAKSQDFIQFAHN